MKITYIMFELVVIAVFIAEAVHAFKYGPRTTRLVIILSSISVTLGELINNYASKVTVYNPSYLFWLPGTDIPLFIICGGIILSLLLYKISSLAGSKLLQKLVPLMFLSLSFPLIEIAGIRTGLWRWPANPPIDTSWIIGVWQFCLIFIAVPALIGIVVSHIAPKMFKT